MASESRIAPDPAPYDAAVEQELARLRLYAPTLLNTTTGHATFFRWIGGIGVVAFLAMFLPWQQSVQGTGTVTALRPQDRPQTIPALIDGRVDRWFVSEGQFVRRGQPIVHIAEVKDEYLDPAVVTRTAEQRDAKTAAIGDKRAVVSALAEQVALLEQSLRLSVDKTRNTVRQYEAAAVAAALDSAVAADQVRRRAALADSGLVSVNDLQSFRLKAQQADAKLAETRAELQNARIELNSLAAEYGEKIQKARADRAKTLAEINEGAGEVAKLENKVASLRIRDGFYRIDAPQDGYVVRAIRSGVGETVKAGDPVVTVQPAAPQRAVELYVKPMDVPLLRPGRHVRVQFDGWPALQFSGWPSVSVGTFGGVIAVVDRVGSADGKFRVLVTPDPTDEPWPPQLSMGSGVYGWAMLDEVRIWFEIWRQLNGFPPSVSAPAGGTPNGMPNDKAAGSKS